MKFKTYVYYETDEDGIILDNEPHFISLKEDVDISKVESNLNAHLDLIDEFEYDIEETEFRKFLKGKADKFANSLPTFRSINN